MNLTPEQRDQVAAELKRFGADLQLTDDQKAKLQEILGELGPRSLITLKPIQTPKSQRSLVR